MALVGSRVREDGRSNGAYKKQRYERLYLKVVYEVFIAPVYAVSMAVSIFLLQLVGVFLVGLVGYVALYNLFSSVLHLPSELPSIGLLAMGHYCHFARRSFGPSVSASALVMATSTLLPSTNEKLLAACCGVSSFAFGCLVFGMCVGNHISIGVGIGVGAIAAVILYWFHLDPGRRSVCKTLSFCYTGVTIKQRDVDKRQ